METSSYPRSSTSARAPAPAPAPARPTPPPHPHPRPQPEPELESDTLNQVRAQARCGRRRTRQARQGSAGDAHDTSSLSLTEARRGQCTLPVSAALAATAVGPRNHVLSYSYLVERAPCREYETTALFPSPLPHRWLTLFLLFRLCSFRNWVGGDDRPPRGAPRARQRSCV